MSEDDKSKIKKLGLDEAIEDLKFLAQKVSDMSQDLAQKAAEQLMDCIMMKFHLQE